MIMMGKRILFLYIFCGSGLDTFFLQIYFSFSFSYFENCAGVLCDGGGSDTVCLVSRNKQRDKQVSNLAHHEQDDNEDKDKEVFNLAHHEQDDNDDSDDDDYCIEDEEDDFRLGPS